MKPEIVYSISNSISQRQQRGFLMRWSEWDCVKSIRAGTTHTAEQKRSCITNCASDLNCSWRKKKNPYRFTINIPVSEFPNISCLKHMKSLMHSHSECNCTSKDLAAIYLSPSSQTLLWQWGFTKIRDLQRKLPY